MRDPIGRDLDVYLNGVDEAEDREDAINELSATLYQASFAAMRQAISAYSDTTAMDLSTAMDKNETYFDDVAESLMEIIERG